jgi:NAD(P)-dependent dehydrogenase (short-subunit alcohol dehydrogenase family)
MTLKGKRIVILGGTSGFGFATAEAAAREGASVVVASSKQENVSRALAALPKGSDGHVVDLTNEDQIRGLLDRIGPFDHLVYTGGEALMVGEFATTNIAAARRAFDVRFWGAVSAAKHAAPHIRPGGSIVLTTGTGGRRPSKGWVVPASILGAIEALTRALAIELAPIRVNAICAGVMKTPMWDQMLSQDSREAMYRNVAAKSLIGHIGDASEVAETYLYLMRQRLSTGQIVIIDGGETLV